MAVWAIDGDETPASVARLLADAALNGEEGVLRANDYLVTELPVPGKFVRVLPGAASIRNAYAGSDAKQNYVVEDLEAVDVPLPQTGSEPIGGVDRVVVKTLQDPEYPGVQAPADGNYDFFDIVDVADLDTYAHPYYKLFEFHQPANEQNFYETYITKDWRRIANPSEHTERMTRPNVGGDTGMTLNATGPTGEWFPNSGGDQDVPIPDWATRAQITATWVNIEYDANVNPYGAYWVEYGPYVGPGDRERKTQEFGFNHFVLPGKARGNWILGDTVYIPAAYRGTTQKFVMKARYNGADKGVHMDAYSGVILDVRFVQVTDQVN